jgi:hypothetical protein
LNHRLQLLVARNKRRSGPKERVCQILAHAAIAPRRNFMKTDPLHSQG